MSEDLLLVSIKVYHHYSTPKDASWKLIQTLLYSVIYRHLTVVWNTPISSSKENEESLIFQSVPFSIFTKLRSMEKYFWVILKLIPFFSPEPQKKIWTSTLKFLNLFRDKTEKQTQSFLWMTIPQIISLPMKKKYFSITNSFNLERIFQNTSGHLLLGLYSTSLSHFSNKPAHSSCHLSQFLYFLFQTIKFWIFSHQVKIAGMLFFSLLPIILITSFFSFLPQKQKSMPSLKNLEQRNSSHSI